MEWLRRVPEELGVDVRRVYLFGFSQGATISFTTLTSKWPVTGLIAGAVLVSGRLLPHMFSEECVSLRSRLAAPEQVRCSCRMWQPTRSSGCQPCSWQAVRARGLAHSLCAGAGV
jgi:carboxylesterase type B